MHCAPPIAAEPLAPGEERRMWRITLRGQPLVSPDGVPSEWISGQPILSAEEAVAAGWGAGLAAKL